MKWYQILLSVSIPPSSVCCSVQPWACVLSTNPRDQTKNHIYRCRNFNEFKNMSTKKLWPEPACYGNCSGLGWWDAHINCSSEGFSERQAGPAYSYLWGWCSPAINLSTRQHIGLSGHCEQPAGACGREAIPHLAKVSFQDWSTFWNMESPRQLDVVDQADFGYPSNLHVMISKQLRCWKAGDTWGKLLWKIEVVFQPWGHTVVKSASFSAPHNLLDYQLSDQILDFPAFLY